MIGFKEVWTVIEPAQKDAGKKARWVRIGVAFVNRDESLSVILDALPVNGKMQIREKREKAEGSTASGQSSNLPDFDADLPF